MRNSFGFTFEKAAKENLNKFCLPLQSFEIEWKIQSYTKDKQKTIIVPYIDARAAMERLNECFGAFNWEVNYQNLQGGVLCNLTIWVMSSMGMVPITKSDGSDVTSIEPVKGGISGALKRACHVFGLGRELYSFPRVMITDNIKYISPKLQKTLDRLVDYINQGNEPPEVIFYDQNGNKT